MKNQGTTVATDVKEDGRRAAAYVSLSDKSPASSLLGPPSAMLVELSSLDQVVADAQADKELTVLMDSLSYMQKLQSLQRRDFQECLYCHLEKVLLESLVARLNERARRNFKKVSTLFIKVPVHQGHQLNELADAAASRAAVDGD